MVMATAFVQVVQQQYPQATIDVIAKKGIDFLLEYFPPHNQRFVFNKEEYNGIAGAFKFGRQIRTQKKYDIFFCMPNSFSSAVMAFASGAKKRVGYKKELRSMLLTHAYATKKNIHRVSQYLDLLQQFLNTAITTPPVSLQAENTDKNNAVVVNINSEASSRRLPKEKAISIINTLQLKLTVPIILVGSPKEKQFVDEVYDGLNNKNTITNIAGKTTVPQLINLFAGCNVILTTDSGPAHVANALGTHTVVLFGAGNENNTAPYNKQNCTIIRLGQLACEPCISNTCKLYSTPKCLQLLDENSIAEKVMQVLQKNNK